MVFCMIDFLSWILESVYRQWLLEVFPSQSNGFHVRIMPVFNAVLPESLKTMSVQYWVFLALSVWNGSAICRCRFFFCFFSRLISLCPSFLLRNSLSCSFCTHSCYQPKYLENVPSPVSFLVPLPFPAFCCSVPFFFFYSERVATSNS